MAGPGPMSGSERRVGDLMHDDVVIVHRHHPLAEAKDRLAEGEAPGLVVVDGDRVMSVIGLAALEDLIADLGAEAHLRDGVPSGLRFCYSDDALDVAAATMEAADADLLAVVDRERRIVGLIARSALGEIRAEVSARPEVDPSDRGDDEHPNLEVYAPWAVIED